MKGSEGDAVIEAMASDELAGMPLSREDYMRHCLRAALEAVSEKSRGNMNEDDRHTWEPRGALRVLIAAAYPEQTDETQAGGE